MSVLTIGDIHLGKGLKLGKPGTGGQLNSRIIDQLNLLDWALDLAIERHVSIIVLTGDVCEDGRPDYNLIYYFFEWLKKCEINNIEVHIVAGNHDLKRHGKFLSSYLDLISVAEFSHVFVYKEIQSIIFKDFSITFVPYTDRRTLHVDSNAKAIEEIKNKLLYQSFQLPPSNKIIIGHLSLEGSIYVGDEFDDYSNEIFCPLNIFNNYDYVLMGHVHKPQILSQKPYIAHTGSLDLSDFGECDHVKNVILFELNGKITNFNVPSRPLRKLSLNVNSEQLISTKNPTNFIVSEIEKYHKVKSLKNSILKLEIFYENSEIEFCQRKIIEDYFNSLGGFHIPFFSEKKSNQEYEKTNKLDENEEIHHSLEPKNAIKYHINSLDLSTEKKEALNKFCQDIFEEYQEKYGSS